MVLFVSPQRLRAPGCCPTVGFEKVESLLEDDCQGDTWERKQWAFSPAHKCGVKDLDGETMAMCPLEGLYLSPDIHLLV